MRDIQQLQRQPVLLAPLDPCDSNFQNTELQHSTTSLGRQSLKENCSARNRNETREGIMKIKAEEGIKDTHENHPIPQPKHGSCFSYIPDEKSSASRIRVYLPFSGSAASVACPTMTIIPLTCLDKQFV